MDSSVLWWIGIIVAVPVYLDVLWAEVRQVVRQARRIVTRLAAYADLPVFSLLATADRDVERIVRAIDALADLFARAQAALAVLPFYKPKGSSPG